MTEAIWLTIAAMVATTAVASIYSIVASQRSAERFDRLRTQNAEKGRVLR